MYGIGFISYVLLIIFTLFTVNLTTSTASFNSHCSLLQCLKTGSTLWANGEVCKNGNIIAITSGEPFCLATALRSRASFTDWKATSRVTIQNVTFPNTYSVKPFAHPRISADNLGKPDTCYIYKEFPLIESDNPGTVIRLKWTDNITPEQGTEMIQVHECFLQIF